MKAREAQRAEKLLRAFGAQTTKEEVGFEIRVQYKGRIFFLRNFDHIARFIRVRRLENEQCPYCGGKPNRFHGMCEECADAYHQSMGGAVPITTLCGQPLPE